MAVNKNFVVKQGLEVATDLLIATDDLRAVGIASTQPTATLGVGGNIAAQSGNFLGILTGRDGLRSGTAGTIFYTDGVQALVGVGTNIPEYPLDVLATGISTALSLRGGALVSGDINVIGFATITENVTIDGSLVVAGLTTVPDLHAASIDASGFSTFAQLVDINGGGQANTFKVEDLTENRVVIAGTGGELEDDANFTFDGVGLVVGGNLNVSGVGTIPTLNTTNLTAVSFDSTNGNFSGIVTASSRLESGDTAITGGLTVSAGATVGFLTGASGVYAVTFYGDGSQLTGIDSSGNFSGKTIICQNVVSTNPGVGTFGNIVINAPAGIITATSGIVTYYGDGSNLTNTGAALSAASGSQRVVLTSLTSGTMVSAATEADLAYNASTNTLTAGTFSGSGASLTSIPNSALDNSTISGISLGGTLGTLTLGVSGNGLSGSDTYDGSAGSTFTVSSNATNNNTASTVVFRDSSGNFSAGTITADLTGDVTGNADTATNATTSASCSGNAATATILQTSRAINGVNFNGSAAITTPINVTDQSSDTTCYVVFTTDATGNRNAHTGSNLTFNSSNGTLTTTTLSATDVNATTVTATTVNSTSDVNLKTNIESIDDAVAIINQIRGVKFRWRDTDLPTAGVIAQEVEEILPELVAETDGTKSVNYNGLVGVLIEAVKELSTRVEHLESQLNNK